MKTETKRADKLLPGDYMITSIGAGEVASSKKHPKTGRWRVELAGPFDEGVASVSYSFQRNEVVTVKKKAAKK
jgi:hypothetical protein